MPARSNFDRKMDEFGIIKTRCWWWPKKLDGDCTGGDGSGGVPYLQRRTKHTKTNFRSSIAVPNVRAMGRWTEALAASGWNQGDPSERRRERRRGMKTHWGNGLHCEETNQIEVREREGKGGDLRDLRKYGRTKGEERRKKASLQRAGDGGRSSNYSTAPSSSLRTVSLRSEAKRSERTNERLCKIHSLCV